MLDMQVRTVDEGEEAEKDYIARVLLALIDADPSDNLSLRDDLIGDPASTIAQMRVRVARFRVDRVKWAAAADRAAVAVIEGTVGAPQHAFVELTYRSGESYDEYVGLSAQWADRLSETPSGRLYQLGLVEHRRAGAEALDLAQDYVYRRYVLPDETFRARFRDLEHAWGGTVESNQLATTQRGEALLSAIVGLFKEALAGGFSVPVMRGYFAEVWAGSPLVRAGLWLRCGEVAQESMESRSRYLRLVELEGRRPLGAAFERSLGQLQVVLGALNAGAAFAAALDENQSYLSRTQNSLSAVASVNEAWASSFRAVASIDGALTPAAEMVLRRIGIWAAIVSALAECVGAYEAHQSDDDSVALGHLISAWGCCIAIAGLLATPAAPPVGAALLVAATLVSLVGWVVTTFTADSPLETFVAHSSWGDNQGDGSAEPPWALGPLRELASSHTRQARALRNLIHRFSAVGDPYVRHRLAHVDPEHPGLLPWLRIEHFMVAEGMHFEIISFLQLQNGAGEPVWHTCRMVVYPVRTDRTTPIGAALLYSTTPHTSPIAWALVEGSSNRTIVVEPPLPTRLLPLSGMDFGRGRGDSGRARPRPVPRLDEMGCSILQAAADVRLGLGRTTALGGSSEMERVPHGYWLRVSLQPMIPGLQGTLRYGMADPRTFQAVKSWERPGLVPEGRRPITGARHGR